MLTILHVPTATAVGSATTQEAQVAAMSAAWSGADVTVRCFSANGVLLDTSTYGPWVVDSTSTPRRMTLGPLLARTFVAGNGSPAARVVLRNGLVDVAEMTAAVGAGADLFFAAPILSQSRTRVTSCILTAKASLPVTSPPLLATLAGADTALPGIPANYTVTLDRPATTTVTVTISVPGGSVSPSSVLTIPVGQTQIPFQASWPTAGPGRTVDFTTSPALTKAGAPKTVTVNVPQPSAALLTGPNTAAATVAQNYRVDLSSPADQSYLVAWSVVNGTPASSTTSIAPGATAAVTPVTFPSAGGGSVDFTISPSIPRTGRPIGVTVSAPAPPPPPPPPPAPPPSPGGGEQAITFKRATSGTSIPFCIGYTFRKGAIPSGQSVVPSVGTMKVHPRSRWSDGSLKFALLAGRVDVSGGTPLKVLLSAGANAPGNALTTADLIATGVVASFTAGAFGNASFGNTEWASPLKTVASTSAMSSWVYRKQIGSDAHLAAFVEVRLYTGGVVEVLPWVENGFVTVPNPSNRSATYTFSLGSTTRFNETIDLKHHQRTPLIGASSPQGGAELSCWFGISDPGMTWQHDGAYFMSTEAVQTYAGRPDTTLPDSRPAATVYSPLQQGGFKWNANPDGGGGSDNMADTGYGRPIGQIPEWDVFYLLCDNPTAFRQVVRNAYSAGRYGIHYRDENTQRPMRFSDHVTRVFRELQGLKDTGGSSTGTLTPAATGGNPPTWDAAHCPSVGYMAHLVTGWDYHLETAQFAAVANHFNITDWVRGGGNGTTTGNNPWPGYNGASGIFTALVQLRGGSWQGRTLVQALFATPDEGDNLRAEFINCVEANCNYFHAIYVAQANNQFGLVYEVDYYGYINGAVKGSPWQQDFFTSTWGLARALDLPISSTAKTRMAEFFDWKARSVIGRLGLVADFHYINANYYNIVNAPAFPNYWTGAGPWYASWAALHAATASQTFSPDYRSSTPGVLGFDFGEAVAAAQGMWGNIQPAISYAVRFGVPGASEAHTRMRTAANWPQLEAAFNTRPVWSATPASGMYPIWRQGKPLNQWFTIANTGVTASTAMMNAGLGERACDAYNGVVVDRQGRLYGIAWGGHFDGRSNAASRINLMADAPAWQVLFNGSANADILDAALYYADGRPTSRHTYHYTHLVDGETKLLLAGCTFGVMSSSGDMQSGPGMDVFDLALNDYQPRFYYPDIPDVGSRGVIKDNSGNIWTVTGYKFTVATKTWSRPSAGVGQMRFPAALDPIRDRSFWFQLGDSQGYSIAELGLQAKELNHADGSVRTITIAAGAARDAFIAAVPIYPAMDFCTVDGKFWFFHSGEPNVAYKITPSSTSTTWAMERVVLGGVTPPNTNSNNSQVILGNRVRWVEALKGFVGLWAGKANLHFLPVA